MVKRVKTVQESDLRMLGSLARNIQRVLPVTQADIDAAAALGKGWVVWKVFEVSDPLDNMRGGTQLIIRQNSIQPGQNVRRVIFVAGPGGQTVVIRGTDYLVLPDAIANSLSYVKAFGGTEQRDIPQPYTQVNYVTNTAQTAVDTGIMIDFAKNYEFEVECRAVSGSWYILQSRASASGNVTGIHGETSGSNIKLVVGNVTVCTSAITRTVGNKLYVKATLNAGTATLYVKDETANTEDTQTGSYGTTQPNPTAAVYLLGNAGEQYVDVNSDIYMARIKENGVTVMDYVPARQAATAGFYDKASGTFKTAETPANLSADGNTVPTPDVPMDIISNNGVIKVNSQGQIYTDGTVETINVHGKNLYNATANPIEQGAISSATGNSSYSDARVRTNGYIPCKPNTTYNISCVMDNYTSGSSRGIYIFEYSDSGYIGGNGWNNTQSLSFTTGANTTRLRFVFARSSTGEITTSDISNVQLELGSTATTYEPYYNGGTATAEMLLKVGDYQDEQEIISGAVTRKVGVLVLNGTEAWSSTGDDYGAAIRQSEYGYLNSVPVLCSHFPYSSSSSSSQTDVICNRSGAFGLRILADSTIIPDNSSGALKVAGIKAFLAAQYAAGTPVIVVYPLATPTTESVTGQALQVTGGDNIVEITQASLTGLELEVEYQAAVSLTIQEVEDAQLSPDVEVTIQ